MTKKEAKQFMKLHTKTIKDNGNDVMIPVDINEDNFKTFIEAVEVLGMQLGVSDHKLY